MTVPPTTRRMACILLLAGATLHAGPAAAQLGGVQGPAGSGAPAGPNISGAGTGFAAPATIGANPAGLSPPTPGPALANPAMPSSGLASPGSINPGGIGTAGPGTTLPGTVDPRTGVVSPAARPRPR